MQQRSQASAKSHPDEHTPRPGKPTRPSRRTIGLIAGAGVLPMEAAQQLALEGHAVRAIAFEGLTDPALETSVEMLQWVRLGQLAAMRDALRSLGLERVLLLGKVPKTVLLDGSGRFDPDAEARSLLQRLRGAADEPLMAAVGSWLEEQEVEVCRPDHLLASMLAGVGEWTARSPTEAELADFDAAKPALDRLGRSGSGQCVVVHQGVVAALEEIEGTDAAIRHAAEVAGPGTTVVKAARPGQDRRFDLPAIGPGTIEAMRDAGATALAVEAGATLVIDREAFVRGADAAGLAVWGFEIVRADA